MASLKVGSHLAYQAHERGATGRSCRSNPAASVTQENSPSSNGVVREIALSVNGGAIMCLSHKFAANCRGDDRYGIELTISAIDVIPSGF